MKSYKKLQILEHSYVYSNILYGDKVQMVKWTKIYWKIILKKMVIV